MEKVFDFALSADHNIHTIIGFVLGVSVTNSKYLGVFGAIWANPNYLGTKNYMQNLMKNQLLYSIHTTYLY